MPSIRALGKNQEGERLLGAGDLQGAVAAFTVALRDSANFPNALRNRSEAYRRLGRLQDADADIHAAQISRKGVFQCPHCSVQYPEEPRSCGGCRTDIAPKDKTWIRGLKRLAWLTFGCLGALVVLVLVVPGLGDWLLILLVLSGALLPLLVVAVEAVVAGLIWVKRGIDKPSPKRLH